MAATSDGRRAPEASTAGRALRMAVAIAGGQSALSRMIGCTQGAVQQMLERDPPMIGTDYALKAEAGTGMPRALLRPDLYPDDPPASWPALDDGALVTTIRLTAKARARQLGKSIRESPCAPWAARKTYASRERVR